MQGSKGIHQHHPQHHSVHRSQARQASLLLCVGNKLRESLPTQLIQQPAPPIQFRYLKRNSKSVTYSGITPGETPGGTRCRYRRPRCIGKGQGALRGRNMLSRQRHMTDNLWLYGFFAWSLGTREHTSKVMSQFLSTASGEAVNEVMSAVQNRKEDTGEKERARPQFILLSAQNNKLAHMLAFDANHARRSYHAAHAGLVPNACSCCCATSTQWHNLFRNWPPSEHPPVHIPLPTTT